MISEDELSVLSGIWVLKEEVANRAKVIQSFHAMRRGKFEKQTKKYLISFLIKKKNFAIGRGVF